MIGAIMASIIATLLGWDKVKQHKNGGSGATPYVTERFCDERHTHMMKGFERIESAIKKLDDKLDDMNKSNGTH